MALLEVRNLEVTFPMRDRQVRALRGIDFTLDAGERLGIVGESGAGKSMAAFAILNLISEPGRITAGEVLFEGRDLTKLGPEELRHIRGQRISMIFQDPMMTLNPVLTIGTQLVECLRAHEKIDGKRARELAIEKLKEVAIPSPETRFDGYPHELSGGLRQRVVIAISLLLNPSIIIADEPTTALDVTIQSEILGLMTELCEQRKVGLIIITHDLAVVSEVTSRLLVMYAGRIVEEGPTQEVIDHPLHPYTRGLLEALPQQNPAGEFLKQIPGTMPGIRDIPKGCAFHPRCKFADQLCTHERPVARRASSGAVSEKRLRQDSETRIKHEAACHYVEDFV